jgi:hypothetical protein
MSHHFRKLVHFIKLNRFEGVPKGSPFSPLNAMDGVEVALQIIISLLWMVSFNPCQIWF